MLAFVAACGDANDGTEPTPTGRGSIVRVSAGPAYTQAQAASIVDLAGVGDAFVARHAVRMYHVVYRTVDASGRGVEASAGVYLPLNAGAVPLVSYSHGTVTEKFEVPSNPASLEGVVNGVLQASHGSVLVAADYLGLGQHDDFHPYLHAATEASAGLDALRAGRQLALDEGVQLDGRLFLYGYSQGGHAAMALHRMIEASASDEFTVTASAPMSGPYDLYGTSKHVVTARETHASQSLYALYILSAYQRLYDLAPRLDALVRAPHDTVGVRLQRHGIRITTLLNVLPPVAADLVQPTIAAAVVTDSTHALSRALRANDVHDWRPRAPVRLYYGSLDRDVSPQNAVTTAARMAQLGADVQAVDLGPFDHGGALLPAYAAARLWFDSF